LRRSKRYKSGLTGDRSRAYYGWLVAGTALVINLMYGIFYAFGVFFTPMCTEFGWTSAETAATLSIHAVTYVVSAILMGKLTDAYGPKLPLWVGGLLVGLGLMLSSGAVTLLQFYLFYGLVASMGVGAMFVPTFSTVIRWFVKRRGLALGLVTVGSGLGALIIPPVCERLIALYGWREALMICSVLVWVVMLVGGLLIKNPTREALEAYGEIPRGMGNLQTSARGITLNTALKTRAFWLLLSVYIFFFASTYVTITYMAPFAVAAGIPSLTAALVLSLFGASSIVGRLTVGFLSDRIGRIPALTICFILLTISILSLMGARNVLMLYLIAAIFGYAFGGCAPQMPAVIGDFFDSKSIGGIYGFFEGLAFGIGGGVGPVLGGYLKDITGGYEAAFLTGGLISSLAIVPLILTPPPESLTRAIA